MKIDSCTVQFHKLNIHCDSFEEKRVRAPSWIIDRFHWIIDRFHWIIDRFHWIIDRFHWIIDRFHWIIDRFHWIIDRFHWIIDRFHSIATVYNRQKIWRPGTKQKKR